MARHLSEQIALAIIVIIAELGRCTLGVPRLEATNAQTLYNDQQSASSLLSSNPAARSNFATAFNVTAQTGASAYLPCRVSVINYSNLFHAFSHDSLCCIALKGEQKRTNLHS